MSRPCKTGAHAIRTADRDAQILALRTQGLTLSEIGDRLDMDKAAVHEAIHKRVNAVTKLAAESFIAAELARFQRMEDALIQQAYGFRPELNDKGLPVMEPLFSTDGNMVLKPDGEPLMVPRMSYTEANNAKALLLRIQDQRIRLLGIAAPAKLITSNINTNNPPPALTFNIVRAADGRPLGAQAVQDSNPDAHPQPDLWASPNIPGDNTIEGESTSCP